MSERKKNLPRCPWCGYMMRPKKFTPNGAGYEAYYRCTNCGVDSPHVYAESTEEAESKAYKAATNHFYNPGNRKLTLEEVLVIACDDYNTPEQETVLWLERRGEEGGYATIPNIFAEDGKNVFEFSGIGFDVALITEGYGKHWRCWRTKPTLEERSKMSWEDEKE